MHVFIHPPGVIQELNYAIQLASHFSRFTFPRVASQKFFLGGRENEPIFPPFRKFGPWHSLHGKGPDEFWAKSVTVIVMNISILVFQLPHLFGRSILAIQKMRDELFCANRRSARQILNN